MEAIQAATGELYGPGHFEAMPRDPQNDSAFGPMDPLRPEPIDSLNDVGRTDPRAWQYQVGWNLPGNGNREVPWQVLRGAATGVGVIRRCIEVRKKHARDLRWVFGVSEDAIQDAYLANPGAGKLDAEQNLRERLMPEINRLREFWRKPWKSNDADMGQWVNAILEDYLTLDAVVIFPRKTYGGDVHDLEIIDAATIKPLLDHRGVRPLPPHPAFQQVLYGFPRGEWTASAEYDEDGNALVSNAYASSELFYRRENFRSFSPYGFSAVEMALFDARLYLARQKWMLAEYDDGSTPLTWIETAERKDGQTMTLTQQRAWEKAYNDKVRGQTAERHRIKVMPNGWKAMQMTTVDERYKPEYDLHLIKLLCSYFGVTIAELGFTEPTGLGNNSWHKGQAEVTGRLGLRPDTAVLTDVVNAVSRQFLRMPPELEFSFVDPSATNDVESDQVMNSQRTRGTITINEERQALGQSLLPFPEANMHFLTTPTGPIFLEGAHERAQQAADAAQMQAHAQALGTAGKLSIEEKRLEDGQAARAEQRDFAREQMQAAQETGQGADVRKLAEISAYRNWSRKHREPEPARPFLFKHVTPDDGFPELDGIGPWRVQYEGWEWWVEDDLTKSAMSWLEWNLKHPNRPRDASGRWVKASTLVEAITDQAKKDAKRGGKPRIQANPEQHVREAIAELKQPNANWVGLSALREELASRGMGRKAQDDELRRLFHERKINLIPEENQKTIRQAERSAAINIGNQDRHLISWNNVDKPSTVQSMNIFTGEGVEEWKRDAEAFIAANKPKPITDVRGRVWEHRSRDLYVHEGKAWTKDMIEQVKPLDIDAARKELARLEEIQANRANYDVKTNQWANGRIDFVRSEIAHHEATKGMALTAQERRAMAGLDPSLPASHRQAKISVARNRANMLSEMEEIVLINQGSSDLASHRFEEMVRRLDMADDPHVPRMRAALANGEPEALHDALVAIEQESGLERIGGDRWLGPDQLVTFDRKLHDVQFGTPQPGQRVFLTRPGYHGIVAGERVRLSKGKVVEATPEEIRQVDQLTGGGAGPKDELPTWESLGRPAGASEVGQKIGHQGGFYERLPGEPRRYRVVNAEGVDISDRISTRAYGSDGWHERNQTAEDARVALNMDALERERVARAHASGSVAAQEAVPVSWSYRNHELIGLDDEPQRREIKAALGRWSGMGKMPGERSHNLTDDPTRVSEPAVNTALRGAVERTEQIERDIAALDRAFELSRIKRAITVYRGYTNGLHVMPDDWQERDLAGMTFHAPIYSATSGDKEAAANYIGLPENRGFGIKVKLPKGFPALSVQDEPGGMDDEGEIILPRNLTFRVTKDLGKDAEGLRWLEVSASRRKTQGKSITKATAPDEPTPPPVPPEQPAPPDQRWPGWLLDAAIAAAVTALLLKALPDLSIGDLVRRFAEWTKAYRPGDPTPDVRQWLTREQPELTRRLIDIIGPAVRQAHIEGALVGQESSRALIETTLAGLDPREADFYDIDWQGWSPGNVSAAETLLEPGGLERLLYQSNVTIKQIATNELDSIGRVLGEGLARGDSPEAIARTLRERVLNNKAWAQRIAVTETNRAMSYAAVMNYRRAGMAYKGWMTAFDQRVCATCLNNELEPDGTPRIVPIDELFPSGDPWPPAHPHCRCAPIPVIRFPRDIGKSAMSWLEWNLKHIHFDPDRANVPDSDYNQHHVDIDASAAAQDDFHQRAAHIFGMDT